MFQMRMYYKELDGHTHVRVFAGFGEGTLGKCGDLVFTNDEWKAFKRSAFPTSIEFIKDE